MAIPSGSGTEVLKRYIKVGQDDTESTAITGVANHIYTILSIIATNQDSSNSHVFYIKVNGLFLTRDGLSIGANQTFVWNDKFVLSGTDTLKIDADSGSDFDVIISYIDQDWS
jgi:hypothetical protein